MGTTLIGWQNYIKTAPLQANSVNANMGIGNLQNDSGSASLGWQTAAGVLTLATGALFTASPALQSTWRAMGLFRTNLTSAASVTFQLWNNRAAPVLVTQQSVAAVNGQAVAVLAADTVADFLQVYIDDPANPDNFINVPLAFAGPAWLPATGASWQSTHGRDDQVVEATTRGGQEYPTLYWQRRHYALALDGVRASEVWSDIDALERVARAGGNVLFAPDVTSAYLQNQAIFGRLKPTADVSYPYQAADRRAWRAQITERL